MDQGTDKYVPQIEAAQANAEKKFSALEEQLKAVFEAVKSEKSKNGV